MKKFLAKIFAIFILFPAVNLAVTKIAFALPEDAILAIVNNDVITYRDLGEYLRSRFLQLKLDGVPESEIKAMMADLETNGIQRLIQDKLILNEANRRQLQIHKEAVDDRIKAVKKNYPSEEIFHQALAQDGLSISDLRERIENQLKVQHFIEMEVKNKIYVNPQEITDYYTQHLKEFQKPERINLDSIFLSKSSDPATAKAKAQETLAAIKSGQDFRKVAEGNSETPALGTVEKGKLLPQIDQAVSMLDLDKVSDVVEVDSGFYILKVLGKTPASTASLEETRNIIYQIIFNEKFRQQIDQMLGQLEKNTFIEIKTEESK